MLDRDVRTFSENSRSVSSSLRLLNSKQCSFIVKPAHFTFSRNSSLSTCLLVPPLIGRVVLILMFILVDEGGEWWGRAAAVRERESKRGNV